jgi:hypothetical protein
MDLRQWSAIVAVLAAAVLGVHFYDTNAAHDEAQTNYRNAISSCERNNPRYAALHQTVKVLAEHGVKPQTRRESASALAKIEAAPFTLPDGETDCRGAIEAP